MIVYTLPNGAYSVAQEPRVRGAFIDLPPRPGAVGAEHRFGTGKSASLPNPDTVEYD